MGFDCVGSWSLLIFLLSLYIVRVIFSLRQVYTRLWSDQQLILDVFRKTQITHRPTPYDLNGFKRCSFFQSCGNYLWFIRLSCLSLFKSMFPRKKLIWVIKIVPFPWQPMIYISTYEPRHEKTCRREFATGKTQTGLLSYRGLLESWNFGFSKYRYYTF